MGVKQHPGFMRRAKYCISASKSLLHCSEEQGR